MAPKVPDKNPWGVYNFLQRGGGQHVASRGSAAAIGRGGLLLFLAEGGGQHVASRGSPAAIGRGGLLLFLAEGQKGEGVRGSGLGNRNLTTPHTRVGKNT